MATYLPAFSAGCRNMDLLFLKVLDSTNICLVWSWIRHLLFFSTLKNWILYLLNFVLCFIKVSIHITLKHVHVYSMFSSQNFSLHLPKKLFESQKKLMMGFETKRQQEVNKKWLNGIAHLLEEFQEQVHLRYREWALFECHSGSEH